MPLYLGAPAKCLNESVRVLPTSFRVPADEDDDKDADPEEWVQEDRDDAQNDDGDGEFKYRHDSLPLSNRAAGAGGEIDKAPSCIDAVQFTPIYIGDVCDGGAVQCRSRGLRF
jgi:hypothetical protein